MEQLCIIPEIRTQVFAGATGGGRRGETISLNRSGTFEMAFRAKEGRIENASTKEDRQENAPEAGRRRNPESLQEQAPDPPPDGQGISLPDEIVMAMGSEEPTAPQGNDDGEGCLGEDTTSEQDSVEAAMPQWASPLILLATAHTGQDEFCIIVPQNLNPPDGATEPAAAAVDRPETATPHLENQGNTWPENTAGQGQPADSTGFLGQEPTETVLDEGSALQADGLGRTGGETSPAEAGDPRAAVSNSTGTAQGASVVGTGQGGSEILPQDRLQGAAETPSAGANRTYSPRVKEPGPGEELGGRPNNQVGDVDPQIAKHQYQNQTAAQGSADLDIDTSDPSIEGIYIEEQAGPADDPGVKHKSRPTQSQIPTALGGLEPPDDTIPTSDLGKNVSKIPDQQNVVLTDNENTVNAVTDPNRQNTTDEPDGVQRTESQGLDNRQAQATEVSQNRPEAKSGVEQTRTVQQLGDTIARNVTLKKGRAVIQLNPPELGKVRVHLTLSHGNELRAVFVADTRDAKLIIESHIETLRAHLDQRGLTMTDCSVDMNNNQGFSLRHHNGNGQTGLWWGRGNRPFTPDVQDVPETVSADTVLTRPANGRVDLVI